MSKTPEKSYENRLNQLIKRARWLEDRTEGTPRDLSFDKQELSALKWAIELIERHKEEAIQMIYDSKKARND